MLLSNQLIYQDRLKVGNLDVAQQYLRLPQKEEGLKKVCRHGGKEGVGNRCWIEEILEQKCAVTRFSLLALNLFLGLGYEHDY